MRDNALLLSDHYSFSYERTLCYPSFLSFHEMGTAAFFYFRISSKIEKPFRHMIGLLTWGISPSQDTTVKFGQTAMPRARFELATEVCNRACAAWCPVSLLV